MTTKMVKPVMPASEAVKAIHSGTSVMVGGFTRGGVPCTLIDALVTSGVGNLTLISNDAVFDGKGHGRLIESGQVKKMVASHIGLNKTAQKLRDQGKFELELVPQGTFVERIRCGGYGLGGFLTPTGVGTILENGKKVMEVDGRKYILELPLTAQVALIKAHTADRFGNLTYFGTDLNFNPTMATAAKFVIAEVDDIVECGAIKPNEVTTPGILVDILVLKEDSCYAAEA